MPEIIIKTVKVKHGTAAEWAAKNTVLESGQEGFETDTRLSKVGDGSTRWNDLEYTRAIPYGSSGPVSGEMATHIADETPHPVYDDGPSLLLLYENAKV